MRHSIANDSKIIELALGMRLDGASVYLIAYEVARTSKGRRLNQSRIRKILQTHSTLIRDIRVQEQLDPDYPRLNRAHIENHDHRRSLWLIAGATVLWCSRCGAWRLNLESEKRQRWHKPGDRL